MRQSKPVGFDVMTRIVYVHSAFSLAVFTSALTQAVAHGSQVGALMAAAALAISIAAPCAMFGVAKQRSCRALALLRLILWIAVVKVSLAMVILSGASASASHESIRWILLNESILIPFAIYWSRPVHARYLASLATSSPRVSS